MSTTRCPDCNSVVSLEAKSCVGCGKPGPFKSLEEWAESNPDALFCPECFERKNLYSVASILALDPVTTSTISGVTLGDNWQPTPVLLTQSTVNRSTAHRKRVAQDWTMQPILKYKKGGFQGMSRYYIFIGASLLSTALFLPLGMFMIFIGCPIAIVLMVRDAKTFNYVKRTLPKEVVLEAEKEIETRRRGFQCGNCDSFFSKNVL